MKLRESEVVYWAAGFGLVYGQLQKMTNSPNIAIVVTTDDSEDRSLVEQYSF